MTVHRLCRARFSTLDGAGGLHVEGRWHPKGWRIVYTAANLACAVLEARVHNSQVPLDYVHLEIEVPDALVASAESLPGWDLARVSDKAFTQSLGEAWLRSAGSAALLVPSVATGGDLCILLNPAHPGMSHIRETGRRNYDFDRRLWDIATP